MLYLAGTTHVIEQDQLPLPSPYYGAYQDSEEVYLEFDTTSRLARLRLVPKLFKWIRRNQKALMYPRGENIARDVSPETFRKLRNHFGGQFSKYERMRPAGIVLLNEGLAENGREAIGVEDILAEMGRSDHKPVRTLDDSSAVMNVALQMLDSMLVEISREIETKGADAVLGERVLSTDSQSESEIAAWRYGKMEVVEMEQSKMRADAPELYQRALLDRNRKWMAVFLKALNGSKNGFALVGLAHLPGEGGLLSLLESAGYKPERLYGVDRPAVLPKTVD
jgi:uncharacterized protein YbaP (TraB family)